MGVGSAKKAAAKSGRSPVDNRRSTTRATRQNETPSPSPASAPGSAKKAKLTPRGQTNPQGLSFTHELPTDQQRRSNGRVTGRNLIVWGRPRMAEKLLLHLQYECTRHKIQLPWDAVAHRLHPGSSGAAVMQHLNRLRRELITEGHLVPPLPSRPSFCETSDMEVRGFIRDLNVEERLATRPVRFDEHVEDRKFNLPDALDHSEEHMNTNTSFGHGGMDATDDEMEPPLPESPTPLGRAQRAMARREGRPTMSREVNEQHEHTGYSGSTQDANPTTPTDEMPGHHQRDSAIGSEASGQQHAPQVYPHAAPPLLPMAYHGAYSFSDAPDGFVTPAAVENGGTAMKSPYEYFPYPYPIWQMGYPMPFPHPHAQAHAHSHAHATLNHAPSPKAPHADPVLSFGSSSTTEFVIKDEFHPAEASTSGSDTQPNDYAQLQDLINENGMDLPVSDELKQ